MTRILLFALLLLAPTIQAQVVYVDHSATGTGTGLDWTDAFQDLNDAINATTTGEIWVAAGRYRPGQPTDPDTASFDLVDGVALYGGFVGTENTRSQRDSKLNTTILDGDLRGNDVLFRTSDNVRTVVTVNNGSATTVLDGFVVRGARSGTMGGGLMITGGAPTIANCVFEDNVVSQFGGGAAVVGGSPLFINCVFSFNTAASGGGLYLGDGGGTTAIAMDQCSFVANEALQQTANDGDGGGLYAEVGVALSVRHGVFLANRATPIVPLTVSWGGGLVALGANTAMSHVLFQANSANLGGGIYCAGHLDASHMVASGNSVIDVNSLPGGRGGAVWAQTATLEGCTIASNFAEKTSGGMVVGSGTIRNSIIWGNTVGPVAPGEDQPTLLQQQLNGSINFFYSDVEGILEVIPGEDPPNPANFPGCIDTDPLFADGTIETFFPMQSTSVKDMRLAAGSPCIDAADNAGFTIASAIGDLSGMSRFFDDVATIDSGLGTAPFADMGAYERGPWSADFPTASFTTTLSVVTVMFTDTSTSPNPPIHLDLWNFGDGVGSCVPSAAHHYSSNNSRNARLRVLDSAFIWDKSGPQSVNPSDTMGPVVSFVSPLDGDDLVGVVTILVDATDDDIVSEVSILLGFSSLATILNAPYSVNWDTTTVPDGFYTLRAIGKDAIGNTTTEIITVHVVNEAPVITCVPAPTSLKVQLGEEMITRISAIGLQPLNFQVITGPLGLTVEPFSGILKWTPTAAQLGLHGASIMVMNASGQVTVNVDLNAIPRRYLIEKYDRPGYAETWLQGISDGGVMSGASENPGNGVQGFLLDQQGVITNLKAPSYAWTFGNDVNDSGLVVGSVFNFTNWAYYSWQNGLFSITTIPSSVYITQPLGVNNSGVRVGYGRGNGGFAPSSAYVTLPGVQSADLLPAIPPGPGVTVSSAANGINNLNQVVGSFAISGANPQVGTAFLYDHATQTSTPFLVPGSNTTAAAGINDAGLMCGVYADCINNAFVSLKANPGVDDWLALRVPGAINPARAQDISADGVVVGDYDIFTSPHGFIATPVELHEHQDLGYGDVGGAELHVTGYLGSGNRASISLTNVPPLVSTYLIVGTQNSPTAFMGGTIVPVPVTGVFEIISSPQGDVILPDVLFGGGGPFSIYMQFVHIDPGAPLNIGFSNAVDVRWEP